MSITLAIGDVLDLLEYVVDEAGEDHVSGCYYISPLNGQPACIVGRVMHIAGTPTEELRSWQGFPINEVFEDDMMKEVKLTMGAMLVLRAAQNSQDNGLKRDWGTALEAAVKAAGRYMTLVPDSVLNEFPKMAEEASEGREAVLV